MQGILTSPHIRGKPASLRAPILSIGRDYGCTPMARGTMIQFLAAVAKEARREAEIKPARIAVTIDTDLSTIYRFEKGRWPRDVDQIIAGYAEELEIEPIELWKVALARWCAQLSDGSQRGE